MASSSSVTSAEKEKEQAYLYASNANVSNFVSVRLSGDHNYNLWKTQMLCLLDAHDMRGLLDHDQTPTDSLPKMQKKYDSLLRGWIFGSLSEDVLRIVVDLHSAESVWERLERCFGSCKTSDQQVSTTKDENTNKTSNIDTNDPTKSTDKEAPQAGKNVSTTKDENTNKTSNSDTNNAGESIDKEAPQTGKRGSSLTMPGVKQWFEAFIEGDMAEIYYLLRVDGGDLTKIKNKKGSTVLHIAAIVGNTKAAELLVEKNKELLHIKDDQGKTPLIKAYENMRLHTALYLLNASSSKDDESSDNAEQISKSYISDEHFSTGIRVLVQAILAKNYDAEFLLEISLKHSREVMGKVCVSWKDAEESLRKQLLFSSFGSSEALKLQLSVAFRIFLYSPLKGKSYPKRNSFLPKNFCLDTWTK
ncbi:hypothetical protein R6Q57_020322 [Mikania cordata]